MNAPERAGGRWWKFGSHFAWAASLFLAGLGAKLGLILAQGFSLPYHDQWPGEAVDMFMPYVSGKFSLTMLCAPHNEHWIVFTRIVDMILFSANGQWDNVLEMACNAAIHCAGVAGFGWVMASLLGKRSWLLIWPALALDLALPFAWENTLWGYQSQFYFLLIFSWLTIWLLGLHKPWSGRWWLGVFTALAALFTVATGFLAAATVIALTGLAAFKQRDWRRHLPTWGFCVAFIGLGLLLKVSQGVDTADKVYSVGALLLALGKSLAWPWVTLPWYAPFNLFPLLLLGWMCLRSTEPPKAGEWMIFGMGIWAGLQGLAGAYARGNGGVGPVSRYMDSLSFISVSGALAALVLVNNHRLRPRFVPLLYAALACWTLGCLGGLGYLTQRAWTEGIPDVSEERAAQTKASRAWVATGDPRVFLAQPADMRISPLAAWLMSQPEMRSILPASVREPLHLAPAQITSNAFVRNGWRLTTADAPMETSWGSYSAQQAAARGTFESQPVKSSALPYLEIAVAGDLGGEGLSLELVELNGGRVTEVRPESPPGGEWVNVHVKAPAGEFKLVARDESDTKWFAFKEPREMGRWSFWALRVLEVWKYIVALGVAGFLVNVAGMQDELSQLMKAPFARKQLCVLLIIFFLIIGGSVIWWTHFPREPIYQGQPISYWIDRPGVLVTYTNADGRSHLGDSISFPPMDTNAVPYLLAIIKRNADVMDEYRNLYYKLPLSLRRRMPAPKTGTTELIRVAAVVELARIDDHSKNITDALVLVLKADKSDLMRSCAALSLARFITNDLTVSNAFVDALHDNDPVVRSVAAEALRTNSPK